MSDLCLVASMLAKMQAPPTHAAKSKRPAVPITQVRNPTKSLVHPATTSIRPTRAAVAAAEFSRGNCSDRVESITAAAQAQPTTPAATTPVATAPAAISPIAQPITFKNPVAALVNQAIVPHPRLITRAPLLQPAPQTSHPAARFPVGYQGPVSGPQLYQQRQASLRAGRLYTRLPVRSFRDQWVQAQRQPTYQEWQQLLAAEATAVARGQGQARLSIVLGDSLSLWLPPDQLTDDQLWLNQGISGDTTAGVLRRLAAFRQTRPETIYLMVGVNDLRRGASDAEILQNIRQIVRTLRQQHPTATVMVQSILPTATTIPVVRIQRLNQQIEEITAQEGSTYLELYGQFADRQGRLRAELTTDGLHLSARGYHTWQALLKRVGYWATLNRQGSFVS
ncbi:MAG: GDSL-type esterase/lipase family protein [Cyanobacteria bacterium P01_H01_bin.121]